jgi:RHH-type proline utilization regulon transcriptional repressor/proline dehydrogenase/delta 1-pyrroline-5-carboxylate dehydrogenase
MGRRPGELNLYFYQPRGLVLALASSRWPLTSACRMLGAALAAGCPAVLKPGRLAHESSLHLWRCLARAGFPAGAVGFAPVQSDVCGDELVARPDVGIVALTGSGEAAARVVANAGRQPAGDSVKRVLAERLEAAPGPPDELYLVAFLEPRVITENTLRRGFAPSDDLLDTAR